MNSSRTDDRLDDSGNVGKETVEGATPVVPLSSPLFQDTLRSLARRVDPKRAKNFLMELANPQENRERLFSMFSGLLPTHGGDPEDLREALLMTSPQPDSKVWRAAGFLTITEEKIREAWRQPTALGRQLGIMGLMYRYLRSGDVPDLAVDPFLMALVRGMDMAERMRYCVNPVCPAPYFIAHRRSQRYCSGDCAQPAQREFKKAWWAEHGTEWREKRNRAGKANRRGRKSLRKGGK